MASSFYKGFVNIDSGIWLNTKDGKPYSNLNNRHGFCNKLKPLKKCGLYHQYTRDGKPVLFHRAVWERYNGPIPKGMHVDHINRDKTDNRIGNLRLTTPKENTNNQDYMDKNIRTDNKSGFKGVSYDYRKDGWVASLGYKGKYYRKRLKTMEEAIIYRKKLEELYYG